MIVSLTEPANLVGIAVINQKISERTDRAGNTSEILYCSDCAPHRGSQVAFAGLDQRFSELEAILNEIEKVAAVGFYREIFDPGRHYGGGIENIRAHVKNE